MIPAEQSDIWAMSTVGASSNLLHVPSRIILLNRHTYSWIVIFAPSICGLDRLLDNLLFRGLREGFKIFLSNEAGSLDFDNGNDLIGIFQ